MAVFQSRAFSCIHKTLEIVTTQREHLISETFLRKGKEEPVKVKAHIHCEGG